MKMLIRYAICGLGIFMLFVIFVTTSQMMITLLMMGAVFLSLVLHLFSDEELLKKGITRPASQQEQQRRQELQKQKELKMKELQKQMKELSKGLDEGDLPPTIPEKKEEEPEDVTYTCPKCNKQFDTNKKLMRHIGMAHYMEVKL